MKKNLAKSVSEEESDPNDMENTSYDLPAGLVLAIHSGRGELVSLVVRSIQKGETVIDKDMSINLIRLIGDLINQVHKERVQNEKLQESMEDLKEAADKLAIGCNDFRLAIRKAKQDG